MTSSVPTAPVTTDVVHHWIPRSGAVFGSRHQQMDIGGLTQDEFLRSLELLTTEVAPRVRRALGA